MVRCIEGLEPELYALVLCETDVFEQRSIPLNYTRAYHRVTPDIAESAGRIQYERVGIEPSSSIPLATIEVRRCSRFQVRTVETASGVRSVNSATDGQRKTRLNIEECADFPATEHGV